MQPCPGKPIRKAVIGCIVALLLSSVLFVSLQTSFSGPRVQGKRLAVWASDLSFPDDREDKSPVSTEKQERHDNAVKAIQELGAKALPFALKCCAVQESTFELKLLEWFDDLRQEVHSTPVQDQWQKGLNIFRVLGTNAAPAIPKLIGFLMRPESAAANNASAAFRYVGIDSIPSLLIVLTNSNNDVAQLAAFSLSHFGTNAIAATPYLLMQTNKRGSLADMAMYALLKINSDPTVVSSALVQYLRTTPQSPFSVEILSWLDKQGTNAALVSPILAEIITANPKSPLAVKALHALRAVDPDRGKLFQPVDDDSVKTNPPPHSP